MTIHIIIRAAATAACATALLGTGLATAQTTEPITPIGNIDCGIFPNGPADTQGDVRCEIQEYIPPTNPDDYPSPNGTPLPGSNYGRVASVS